MDLFESGTDPRGFAPLAERMRPAHPDHLIGQDHLLAPGKALRMILDKGILSSFILWGPPGTGKTTIARMAARSAAAEFIELSAVSDGIPRIREVVQRARDAMHLHQRRTVVFVDEIHRWNKTAQDAVLPHVESGLFTLIGATTENVSFEVRPALLSRTRVFRLELLGDDAIRRLVQQVLTDKERGFGERDLRITTDALDTIVQGADGDVRKALGAIELAAAFVGDGEEIGLDQAEQAGGLSVAKHDTESHFDLMSAFQKSARGSDVDASLYYMARLIAAGDTKALLRRMVVVAAEDVGMADPQALVVAQAAASAYERVGSPEGDIILAQAVVHIATAPKSNRSYMGLKGAREAVEESPSAPVPLHLRNAPTEFMASMGYKEGYEYPFEFTDHFSGQRYLPDSLSGRVFYEPSGFGFEKEVRKRLEYWRNRRSGD